MKEIIIQAIIDGMSATLTVKQLELLADITQKALSEYDITQKTIEEEQRN